MIVFIWRILLNAHPMRAELRRHIRTEDFFTPLTSTAIWFDLSLNINFIQPYSIQTWKGVKGNLESIQYFSVSFVFIFWSMDFSEQGNYEERAFLFHLFCTLFFLCSFYSFDSMCQKTIYMCVPIVVILSQKLVFFKDTKSIFQGLSVFGGPTQPG